VAERMTVVIAPEGGQENLTVEDAMRQVLSVFELLSYSTTESQQEVVWRLVEAKTNSPPFSVTAEARSIVPGINIDHIAKIQKKEFTNSLSEFRQGKAPEKWSDYQAQTIVKDLFERLTHGVNTQIFVDSNNSPILLTGEDAIIAENNLADYLVPEESKTKPQMGSIEGILCAVTTYYNKPAIVIKERKSGEEITCTISDELSAMVMDKATFDDVWKHRRVVVRGLITYGKVGHVKSVSANILSLREERSITIEEIRDRNFTNNLSAIDYLNKLREGQLG